MSILKLVLGFLVGAIACGILLALISLKTPILANGEPALLKKDAIVVSENSDSGEQKVNTEAAPDDSVEAPTELTSPEVIEQTPEAAPQAPEMTDETVTYNPDLEPQIVLDEPEPQADAIAPAPEPQVDATVPAQEPQVQDIAPKTEPATTSLFKKAGNTLTLGSGSGRLPSVNSDETATPTQNANSPVSSFESNANDMSSVSGPLLSIILVDEGAIGVPQAELLKQETSYSFAVNGARSDAGFVTADYRDAGFEIVALLNREEAVNLQNGEEAASLVRATLNNIPDAVAFVDDPSATLQKNRRLFGAVLADVSQSGHGVLAYKGGLSSMMQAAADLGLANGLINRYLDATFTDNDAIGRAIDRATIDAAKDGAAIILATGTPELLSGINAWVETNGADKVTLVPVSAAMKRLSR